GMIFQGHQHVRGCSLSWSLCWVLSLALVGGVHPARRPRYLPTPDINSRMRGSAGQRGASQQGPDFYQYEGGVDSDIDHAITQEIDDYQDEPGFIQQGLSLNQPENEQNVNSHANLFRMLQVFPSVVGTGFFVDAKSGTRTKDYQQEQEYDDLTSNELVRRPQVAKLVSLDLPKKKRGLSERLWYQGPTAAPKVATTTTQKAYPRSCLFYLKICKS
ncbi:unnamed protein product, partial [Meganyctiphanes norvegica]